MNNEIRKDQTTIETEPVTLANGSAATTQSPNDNTTKLATTAYVDSAIGVENLWDRFTGTPNYILPHTAADDIGATGSPITKGWFNNIDAAGTLTIDTINEHTGATGVTIEDIVLSAESIIGTTQLAISTLANDVTIGAAGVVTIEGHWEFSVNVLNMKTNNDTHINAYAGKNIILESVEFDDSLIVAPGTFGSGTTLTTTGTGVRMIWYPKKAAFRAGNATSTQWDDANIGNYSAAFGTGSRASGESSFAAGTSTASGTRAWAMGATCTASGQNSFAAGSGTQATNSSALAWGDFTTASGLVSVALGNQTTASGGSSFAVGSTTTASGSNGTAMGDNTTASGVVSTAMGGNTTATGIYTTATGNYTTAQARNSFVIGRYNEISGTLNSWVATDPLFVVGIGSGAGSPANALTLLKNGKLGIGVSAPSEILDINGNIKVNGGQIAKRTASAVDYNPSILTTDYLIAITDTSVARAVTISTEDIQSGSTANPRIFVIKDESGGAGTNNITVSGESGNIDGVASVAITGNYESITIYADGTNLWII